MRKALCLLLLLFTTGCRSVSSYEMQSRARALTVQGKTKEAAAIVASYEFYPYESSRLVRYLDNGTMHYLNGNYYQALQQFDKAREAAAELYTQSISKTILAGAAGQSLSDYVGERYELSLLRFYQSLCHYHLSRNGVYEAYSDENGVPVPARTLSDAEKRRHLSAARAALLDWDTLLNDYSDQSAGKNQFKTDMMAKTWGGFVHQNYGTTTDLQIARQLYRDVPKVLLRNYSAYPAYNTKFREFGEDYARLSDLPEETVRKRYTDETPQASHLKGYASSSLKKLESRRTDNVHILLKTGLITLKKKKTTSYYIPMALLLGYSGDSGFQDFVFSVMAGQTIEFEIPQRVEPSAPPTYEAVIRNADGKIITRAPMALTEPLSEIAYAEYQRIRGRLYSETAARLAAKHAAALAAAYASYDENNPSSLAFAHLSYSLARLGIEMSESADLRYWGTLPANIWIQSFRLPTGRYVLEILADGRTAERREFEVEKKEETLIDLNIFREGNEKEPASAP